MDVTGIVDAVGIAVDAPTADAAEIAADVDALSRVEVAQAAAQVQHRAMAGINAAIRVEGTATGTRLRADRN